MIEVLAILLLSFFQLLAGFGLLDMFRVRLKPGMMIPLSLITGIAIFSFIPFVLQLFFIPLTAAGVFISILIVCLALNMDLKNRWRSLENLFIHMKFRVRLYEHPAFIVIGFIVLISVWRCYYLPPTPRDLTSGAEVIASYTVKEKTMINSVFSVDLSTTNNQYKPPFITSLQVIYKYAGLPFGQLWLSTLFVSFLVFLYHAMSLYIHRLLSGIFLVFFLAIPEMYAYTFMALFDYPNAIYFFLSCWFLFEFFRSADLLQLLLSGVLMGFATYTRSETLVLACLLALALAWYHFNKWHSLTQLLRSGFFFLFPSVIVYIISVTIYIDFYLPVPYEVGNLVNSNILNPLPLFNRFIDMNDKLFLSSQAVLYYGYFYFIFLLILILDLVFSDKLQKDSRNWLYAVLVIYLGYPILGYLLPLLDIEHSTKRGMFKIFPLMLLYMGTSRIMIQLSTWIREWEEKKKASPAEVPGIS